MLIIVSCMALLLDAYVRPSADVFPNLPWLSAMVLMSLCNCLLTYICIYVFAGICIWVLVFPRLQKQDAHAEEHLEVMNVMKGGALLSRSEIMSNL